MTAAPQTPRQETSQRSDERQKCPSETLRQIEEEFECDRHLAAQSQSRLGRNQIAGHFAIQTRSQCLD